MKHQTCPNRLVTLAALLLLAWPLSGWAQFNFTTSGGAVTITGYTGTNANVVIPSATNGYPVKNIGLNAFRNNTTVTNVTIPDSVTSIGSFAFQGCSSLASVTLGNNLVSIGNQAFQSCSALQSMILPASLASIGTYAFSSCSGLTSVVIPSSVTGIGSHAFGSCVFLSTAYFQGNAPKVNNGAGSSDNTVFYGNSGSFSQAGVVYYLPGTTGWGATFGSWPTVCTSNTTPMSAFAFVTNNGSITITSYVGTNPDVITPDSINGYPVTTIGDNAFSGNYQLRSVLLPSTITSIGNQAFYNCYNLVSVPLPGNLTSIGDHAFQSCDGVTYMTIPSGVTNIGSGAFMSCYSLLNISVTAGNPNYASLGGVLFDNAFTTLIQCPTALAGNYIVPNSVTNIDNGAFFGCSGLTSVTIPNSVLAIGDSAFSGCHYLGSITVATDNPNYTSVGGVLFDKALTTLIQYPNGLSGNYVITNSVTSIGAGAFSSCYGLQSVTIPDSVTNIGSNAFIGCSSLTNITVGAANPNYASVDNVLFNETLTTLIQYPGGLAGHYAVPNGVTNIGDYAFYNCAGLTNLTFPDSVTGIGNLAFIYCFGLTSLALGNGVNSIGDSAFYNCFDLTSVTIPNSVTNIGQSAFAADSSLHQAYFQGSAPTVNGGAGSADKTIFQGESGTVFYQPGTTGWDSTFGSWPTSAGSYQPQPQVIGSGQGFGVQSNGFQFNIFWATNTAVVVEVSTNLLNWTPVVTNALVSGNNAFTDSNWTNFPTRFYRVRSQ